jgi:hypothetical protein
VSIPLDRARASSRASASWLPSEVGHHTFHVVAEENEAVALRTCPFTIVRAVVCENPFYSKPEDFLEELQRGD